MWILTSWVYVLFDPKLKLNIYLSWDFYTLYPSRFDQFFWLSYTDMHGFIWELKARAFYRTIKGAFCICMRHKGHDKTCDALWIRTGCPEIFQIHTEQIAWVRIQTSVAFKPVPNESTQCRLGRSLPDKSLCFSHYTNVFEPVSVQNCPAPQWWSQKIFRGMARWSQWKS